MKEVAFVDTNVFVFGLTQENCNSKKILELAETGQIKIITSELVVRETARVFARIAGEEEAYYAAKYVLCLAEIIPKRKIFSKILELKGQIKEKDLENLATVKQQKITFLVSFDRDYKNFSEYKTPKQFVAILGIKPEKNDY